MYEADLNPAQAEAVAQLFGPVLVFAGAGSGKTRVITYRVANLIAKGGVAPERILAVTFTNKAAREMRERIHRLVGGSTAERIVVGTFHATCARLLRSDASGVGLTPNFVIYDTSDQKALMTRAIREKGYDEKRFAPRQVLGWIGDQKQKGLGPDGAPEENAWHPAYRELYVQYERQLRACNAVDFDDLILLVMRLLEDPTNPVGQQIRNRYDSILVDEFQDTNVTQYRLIRELSSAHRNLCVVGDDDQSIYRWRGADIRNIRGFRNDFPDARVIKLEQNYRSSGVIVRAATEVISRGHGREDKRLWTANPEGDLIEVVACQGERQEAAFVVACANQAIDAGVSLSDVAVFYRVNAQSRVLEEALRAARISYQIIGGMKFFERAEVKDALSYLRAIDNPKSDLDVLRIINTPARGIGSTTLDKITTHAAFRGITVTDALMDLDAIKDLANAARKRVDVFTNLMDDLRTQSAHASPSQLLEEVLQKSGTLAGLRQENTAEADARLENLLELGGSLTDYETEALSAGEVPTLAGFLERVSLVSDVDTIQDAARITLMTVHAAKGLEFELVLLTGMEEDMFPYRGMDGRDADDLEEERRLAYVAITRAKKKLYVTHVSARQIFGTTRWGTPSRFLADLPGDCVVLRSLMTPTYEIRNVKQASAAPPPRDVPIDEERFVDRSFFDDATEPALHALARGMRVLHDRFGEGHVLRVNEGADPSVVAHFPGWGDKQILARFLKW